MKHEILYCGDREDMRALVEEYGADALIQSKKQQLANERESLRNEYLKDGILMREEMSPRIFRITRRVQEKLGLEGEFDIICTNSTQVNAAAIVADCRRGVEQFIVMTSAALELLNDDELAFVLGHEFGHLLCGHHNLLLLQYWDQERNCARCDLPYLGSDLFWKWQKKAEISSDRFGLVAAGSFDVSAVASMKIAYGLSERNINVDIDVLLKQIEEMKDEQALEETGYRTHPIHPVRLKALQLFGAAWASGGGADLTKIDDEIAKMFEWAKRYPRDKLDEAVMKVVALAGLDIIGCDGEIHTEEVELLYRTLHAHFTDDPLEQFVADKADREKLLGKWLGVLREKGRSPHKGYVISRLADFVMAEGRLCNAESGILFAVAEAIGMPAQEAHGILTSAMHESGYADDYRMKRIVETVRRALETESGPPALPGMRGRG